MGKAGAKILGMEKAPNTLEESITKTVALVSRFIFSRRLPVGPHDSDY